LRWDDLKVQVIDNTNSVTECAALVTYQGTEMLVDKNLNYLEPIEQSGENGDEKDQNGEPKSSQPSSSEHLQQLDIAQEYIEIPESELSLVSIKTTMDLETLKRMLRQTVEGFLEQIQPEMTMDA
jgi:hypothetical protein